MLTIKEISEVSFGKAGFSGYKPSDVDKFIDDVLESFKELLQENDSMKSKLAELTQALARKQEEEASAQQKLVLLAEKVESYRKSEDGISGAILSAQKMSQITVQEAKDKAQIILHDATMSARKMLDDAKLESSKLGREYAELTEKKREELEEMKKQVSAFRVSLLEMYKKHLDDINRIPSFGTGKKPAKREQIIEEEEKPKSRRALHRKSSPQTEPEPDREAATDRGEQMPEKEAGTVKVAVPKETVNLEDKVDFTRENFTDEVNVAPKKEKQRKNKQMNDYDLSDVGIDLEAYSSIPETLKEEKKNHFTNLEFGDNVDVSSKRKG